MGPVDPSAPPRYKLFGVVEHSGLTANSGHYTATVQNSRDQRFYRCNDSQIGDATAANMQGGGAYLLFYKRIKGTSRWAGMERIITHGLYNAPKVETDEEGFTMVVKQKKNKTKRAGAIASASLPSSPNSKYAY